jgi:hypothetical protein
MCVSLVGDGSSAGEASEKSTSLHRLPCACDIGADLFFYAYRIFGRIDKGLLSLGDVYVRYLGCWFRHRLAKFRQEGEMSCNGFFG